MTESIMLGDRMFSIAFPIVWKEENGTSSETVISASDNPADPGGYTRGGIALNETNITREQLDAMTYQDFFNWYKANVWVRSNCDLLPWPLALIVFDGEVVSGGEGVKALQQVLGVVQDGDIGPKTISGVINYADKMELAAFTLSNRDAYFRSLSTFETFGRGWMKRLFTVALSAGIIP